MNDRRRHVRRLLVAAVILAFAILAEAPYAGTALVVSAPVPSPDAIVSLASHEWERLPEAVAMAQRYPDALVVLTVPREVTAYNCHDCARRPERLVAAGVGVSRIRQVPITAAGTFGEALAMKRFMQDHDLAHLLVVTSPYHTRRSLATFRDVFAGSSISVGVVPASATSPARPASWWWSAYDRAYVRYEWAAIAYYWLRYGVPVG